MRNAFLICAVAMIALATARPASARVQEESETGFVVQLGVDVPASLEDVWNELVQPERWWDDANTFSGDAANLTLEQRAGGCFCELLPADEAAKGAADGGAEHMRVLYVEPPRALRMTGALGPLQPDPVTGILTIVLQKTDTGTRIMWEYAVSGHVRKPDMAAAMDEVLTRQLVRLGEKLGARLAPRKQPDAEDETADEPANEAEAPDDGEEAAPTGKGESEGDKAEDGNSDEADDIEADGDEVAGGKADLSDEGEDEKPAKGKDDKAKAKLDRSKVNDGVLSEEGDDNAEAENPVKDSDGKAKSEKADAQVDEWVLFDDEEEATEPAETDKDKNEKAKANKGKAKAEDGEPDLTEDDDGGAETGEDDAGEDKAESTKPAKSSVLGR